MPEQSATASVQQLMSASRELADHFLEGLSTAYQQLELKWRLEVPPDTQRWQDLVNSTHDVYRAQAQTALAFAEAAETQGNRGIAEIMRNWGGRFAEKADKLSDPVTDAKAKLDRLVASWENTLRPFANQASHVPLDKVKFLGPLADAIGTAEGWKDAVTSGDTTKLAEASVSILTAELVGAGMFGVAVAFGASVGAAAILAGIAAAGLAWAASHYAPSATRALVDLLGSSLDPFFKHVVDPVLAALFGSAQRALFNRDPLTLDLDGDGLETVGSAQSNILFDHDGDGILTGTGWVLGDDGFLVLDRNGNGVIDSGLELFGDSTPLDGNGRARDGFEALAQEDTNGDGIVSAADARWDDLRVWRDANQDGVSQPDELLTLASLGITSLNVASTEHSHRLPNGNQIADLGTYTRADGSSGTLGAVGQLADVNLAEDTFHREFTDAIALAEGVTDLPNMQASGKVRDLWEAASLSASLKDTLTLYSQAGSREAQLDLLDTLLLGWAQTAGLPDVYARAAALTGENQYGANPHGYVIRWASFGGVGGAQHQIGTWSDGSPVYDSAYAGLIQHWEQRFKVLEAFNGRPYFVFPGEPGVGPTTRTGRGIEAWRLGISSLE